MKISDSSCGRSIAPETATCLPGVLFLLCGGAMLLQPFRFLGWTTAFFPWAAAGAGVLLAAAALLRRPMRKIPLLCGAAAAAVAVWLMLKPEQCDRVLWYVPAAALIWSGLAVLRSGFRPAAARQTFRRVLGGLTAGAFGLLMLVKPRSGLSDALTLIGIFFAAWGVYLIALPPRRE